MSPSTVSTPIRPASADELATLAQIEDDAGQRYADAGLPPDLEGLTLDELAQAQASGLLWVATAEDSPIGFAMCSIQPDVVHLREIDVLPTWMGRGVGRALIDFVAAEARHRGLSYVSLTTFRDVPWNAPLYRHLGFEIWTEPPAWIEALREEEDSTILGRWPRVAMMRRVR